MPGNDTVMGVDFGGLAELDVVCLGLGNLQGGLELVHLDNFGYRSSSSHVLAYLYGSRQWREGAGNASADLKFIRLFLVQGELGLSLVDFGLRGGK